MLKKYVFLLGLIVSPLITFADEIDLSRYEKSLYSHNGEDGILAKIIQLIKPRSPFCVEFGAYDGTVGSSTCLLRKQGWDCLLLDRAYEKPTDNFYKEFITAENINELLEKYQVPCDLTLLSIDIGYNNFYIWQAINKEYKPYVVVIEYNAEHLPSVDKVVKYKPYFSGDGTNYTGASILALYNLGRAKGYSLIYADKSGSNLFFIRDDILNALHLEFKNVNNVEKIYNPSTHTKYKQDSKHREYVASIDLLGEKA